MVRYAYDNVPLYRRKYDAAGINPEDIRSLDDFRKLPLLTKEELQAGFPHEIISKKVALQNCYIVSTSGHSGSPVRLYRTKRELSLLPLVYFLTLPWLPRLFRSLSGVMAGRRITIILPRDDSYDLYRAIKSFAGVPRFLRPNLQFVATETDLAGQLTALIQHKPDVIASDLSALKNLAAFAGTEGLLLPAVKLLIVGSELIDKHSRKTIGEAFKGKVLEHYGSEEAGTIAIECPRGEGLHLLWRNNYVETLDKFQNPCIGVPGQVVVTNLFNKATPVIRYSGMMDMATISSSPCSCQTPKPCLKVIDGRIVDSFLLPDGRIMHPFNLTIPLEHIPGILSYQIIQEKPDLVKVLLVTKKESGTGFAEQGTDDPAFLVKSHLGSILGNDVRIEVVMVDSSPNNNGLREKHKTVISLVRS